MQCCESLFTCWSCLLWSPLALSMAVSCTPGTWAGLFQSVPWSRPNTPLFPQEVSELGKARRDHWLQLPSFYRWGNSGLVWKWHSDVLLQLWGSGTVHGSGASMSHISRGFFRRSRWAWAWVEGWWLHRPEEIVLSQSQWLHLGTCLSSLLGFPGGLDGKESACSAGDSNSTSGLGPFPWRRRWLPAPVFLPGEFLGLQWNGLQSMRSQTVEHDWATNTHTHLFPSSCWGVRGNEPLRNLGPDLVGKLGPFPECLRPGSELVGNIWRFIQQVFVKLPPSEMFGTHWWIKQRSLSQQSLYFVREADNTH